MSSSPHYDRIYIDSNVLIYYFKPRHKPQYSALSKRFLKNVEEGRFEGIVSIFSILELIKIIREILVQLEDVRDPKEWEKEIRIVIETIFKTNNIKIVEGPSKECARFDDIRDLLYATVLWDSFELMNKYQGKILWNGHEFRHEGLYPADTLHLVLAKKTGCNKIATFDRDFDETRDVVQPIILDRNSW